MKNLNRLAYSIKESGFFDSWLGEDYSDVEGYLQSAMQELYKALEVEDAMTLDGYQALIDISSQLQKYIADFENYRVIPLTNRKNSLAYSDNIGFAEMMKFQDVATDREKRLMDYYLEEVQDYQSAWELLKKVTKVDLL